MQPLILIPSRFNSSRFPGKPLALINGKPMVRWVYENLQDPKWKVCIVTDDSRVEECVLSFGGSVVRVDDDVISGTDRIYLAYQRHFKKSDVSLVLNIQGDEPLIEKKHVQKLIDFHLSSPQFDISTLYLKKVRSGEEFHNPNKVKIALNESSGHCFYFSRAPIPFDRSKEVTHWFHHVGVYSYKVNGLEKFYNLESSVLEKTEGLEQLKALENNMIIGACELEDELQGVDVPSDIGIVEKIMKERR